jgi:hypothetical protein
MQRAILCFFICWWNVCCTGPQPPPVVPVYDQTVHLVVSFADKPTWGQSASATVAPLISPVAAAIKLFITAP